MEGRLLSGRFFVWAGGRILSFQTAVILRVLPAPRGLPWSKIKGFPEK
jgi:hypothetical protein